MAAKPLRILVSGDVEGNFAALFKRVDSIQSKSGKFDLLLCVGDFFGPSADEWSKFAIGHAKAPISTLILGPNKPELVKYFSGKEGTDLCENITYLGRRGHFTGSSGLHISYLSGVESSDDKGDDTHFCKDDVAAVTASASSSNQFKGIDLFITSQWPKGVEKYGTAIPHFDSKEVGSEMISEAARMLRPRYHFCGMQDIFYERQPYRNHQVLNESARQVTRFIALAKVANKEKKKYLYAFSIVPMSKMDQEELVKQPQDCTECPYKPSVIITQKSDPKDAPAQFFYDMSGGSKGQGGQKRRGREEGDGERKKPRKPPQPQGPCWFCLGSPEVEKHLVISVGTHCYLALAKGGLVPDNLLILPIGHYSSTTALPSDIREEIEQYKIALKNCFRTQGKAVVFYERNYRCVHLQIQVIPIPEDLAMDVKDTFIDCAESENIELAEIPKHSDITQILSVGQPYFYAELPGGDKLLHRISKGFPLLFGREVLAQPSLLNMPERIDWKECKASKEEEKEMAANFKKIFKSFDFTLD